MKINRIIQNTLVAATAVGFLPAQAAIPDADGVFTACYVTKTGTMRLIDAAKVQTCKAGELKITWNQAGQQGLAGPAGLKGDTGATGPAGQDGKDGLASVVVDSTDKVLGNVIGSIDTYPTRVIVAMNVTGGMVAIAITRNDYFRGTADDYLSFDHLYFTGFDCSGDAYAGIDSDSTPGPFKISFINNSKKLFVESGEPTNGVSFNSIESALGISPEICRQVPGGYLPTAIPMTEALDLNTTFTPPFTVVIQ